MTVSELIEQLRTADPDARVVFLPFGADEDELEDVGVVEVFAAPWTIERRHRDGSADEFLYSGSPQHMGSDSSERVEYEPVKVVVLSIDQEFLRSRNFARSPND